MNASEAAIPETAKNTSTSDAMFSRYVELSNGTGVHILAWGVGEVRENFVILKDILSDVFSDGSDLSKEGAFNAFVDKQFNRIIKLVNSSISDPGITIESIRGMDNLLRVVEAFIEVNGLFEALGKVMEMATKAAALVKVPNA